MMTNTQGLDALAALCGSTSTASATAASEGGENAAASAPVISAQVAAQSHQQLAAASLYNVQMQQLHQALAMRQAQALQQQQQQAAAVAQPPPATAPTPPAAGSHQQLMQAHLSMLQAAAVQQHQQQQQQQQQQHSHNHTHPAVQQHHQHQHAAVQQAQAAQLAAAQLFAAQQQAQPAPATTTPAMHPNLAALSRMTSPAALAGLAAAGGQVLPVSVPSPALQVGNPSSLMPPPPNAHPAAPPSSTKAKTTSTSTKPSSPKRSKSSSTRRVPQMATSAAQPPIQDIILEWEDKKQAKRAANRLSAHLSRKRKKNFIEDLKDENVELRRKELILRSIPDLIVVFDSSGCISFVSHSITRFLDYSVEEIEHTSFWDCLTEDSVRSIKSSFMDALAVKRPEGEDSTPLANGDSLTVTMVHKGDDDDGLSVSLKGVVHFAGESPECVCSIRPDASARKNSGLNKKKQSKSLSSSSSAKEQVREERAAVPVRGAPSHQVSDIDSVQS